WSGGENDFRSAQLLKGFRRVGRSAVDVHVRTEFSCERLDFGAAPDRRHSVSTLARELNAEMTDTANALHRHKVAGQRTAAPHGIERGHAGQRGRGRVDVAERFGFSDESPKGSDHLLLISAAVAHPGHLSFRAIAKRAAPAGRKSEIVPAVP